MLTARFYTSDAQFAWEELVTKSINATFLHSRRFLSYHGSKFKDRSILLESENKLLGIIPIAESLDDNSLLISHPGATFGGFIGNEKTKGHLTVDALQTIIALCHCSGYTKFIYKPIPHIYHRAPAQDDLYALFRMGAKRTRCDLSVCIDTTNRGPISERRKRGQKKSLKAGVAIHAGPEFAPLIWEVLFENLDRKHGAKPVHSLDEILNLTTLFPNEIEFVAASIEDQIVAGVVLFKCKNVWHAQYIASNEQGYNVCALDSLFESLIQKATLCNVRFFDFGICNENQGLFLNQGLYQFKSEFGGSGLAYEFYEIDIKASMNNSN